VSLFLVSLNLSCPDLHGNSKTQVIWSAWRSESACLFTWKSMERVARSNLLARLNLVADTGHACSTCSLFLAPVYAMLLLLLVSCAGLPVPATAELSAVGRCWELELLVWPRRRWSRHRFRCLLLSSRSVFDFWPCQAVDKEGMSIHHVPGMSRQQL